MLTSIRQVNEEFFRTFYGVKINVEGEEKSVLCRYARKSSYDYSEEQENQIYPCIAIQDYTPTIKREWYVDMKSYFGGKSLDGLTGYLFMRPIWMEFRYDVSIASKSYKDFIALQDYFMQNYVYGVRLMMNKHLSGEDLVGDVVPYTIRENYIPRTDGVYEINYEFTCSVWLQPQKPQEVDLVQKIVVNGAPTTLGGVGDTLVDMQALQTLFTVKVLPYDGSAIDGNSNKSLLGYKTIVGDVAELLKENVADFMVELYRDETLLDRRYTDANGDVKVHLPQELGDYILVLSKDGHYISAHFSLKEINSGLVFLWVFE